MSGKDKVTILEGFEFYREASRALRDEIETGADFARLEKGSFFFREGEKCAHVGFVASGNLRVYKQSETGREITLYHVEGGQTCLVNMLCAFLDTNSPAFAAVDAAVEALAVPAGTFRDWVHQSKTMQTYVFTTISGRMVDLMALVEEVAFQRTDRRLAEFLLRRTEDDIGEHAISTTHEQIALELGTSRELVSRLLKDLERRGAIELTRGRIVLRDKSTLRLLT